MKAGPQRPTERDGHISELNTAIEALNLAKDSSGIVLAKAVFGSVSVVLAMIRVSFLPIFVDRLQTEMDPGYIDKPGGLRRTWAGLC